jgi:hypothetical protein
VGAPRNPFQYSIVRVVPDIARGECVNTGVILMCRPKRYLGARVGLDPTRLAAIAPGLSPVEVQAHLEAIVRIASGDPDGGPIAQPRARRPVEHDHPGVGDAHGVVPRPGNRARPPLRDARHLPARLRLTARRGTS